MNQFLKKMTSVILLTFMFFCSLVTGVVLVKYNHAEDYPASIKSKYERLDSLKNTEKIIICGGSSSSYSIDSKEFQNQFKMPVINTSLAMSLGSYFHLNMVKDYLNKGDVVIYIPEYEFYYGKENGDDFLFTTAFYYPEMIKDFTDSQKLKLVHNSIRLSSDYYTKSAFSTSKKKKSKNKQYNRQSYSFIGDNISLIDVDTTKIEIGSSTRYERLKSFAISTMFLEHIESFNTLCNSKGAKFYITFPPIEESQYDRRFRDDIISLKENSVIKFIGDPADYMYSVEYFYDSSYHLNGLGRDIRSNKLINEIKNIIN